LNTAQLTAANQEYQSILDEISNIGSTATYNGNQVFTGTAVNVYTGDSTTIGSSIDALTIDTLSKASIGDATGTMSYTAGSTTVIATISYTGTAGETLAA